jgi:DtxR family Mn-dependent transcriptional regulator
LKDVVSTVEAIASGEPVTATIRRLGEPVQFDPELLAQLRQAGVVPGNTVRISPAGGYVLAEVEGFEDGLELPHEVASHIFVAASAPLEVR